MNLKHSLSKKWKRVTDSRYTKAFVITSIIQTLILVYLQFRLLSRNAILYVLIAKNQCSSSALEAFAFLMLENIMFFLFNFYQLYFCLNAIFHQSSMQIFAIVVINIGYIILGIIQMIEVKINLNKIESTCSMLDLKGNYVLYELPHIAVSAVIAILMAALSRKLHQQFGWNSYKKIGCDIEMQKRFRTTLIFAILLKIDLLYVISYNTIVTPFVLYAYITRFDNFSIVDKTLVFGSIAIMVLVLFFQALAYKSIEKEWKIGMIVFIIFWILATLDFALVAFKFGEVIIQYGLYSWIILICTFVICAVLTFVYAIMTTRNFGKGLKEYLDKSSKDQENTDCDSVEKGPINFSKEKKLTFD